MADTVDQELGCNQQPSTGFGKIEEDDNRRIADRTVVAGEFNSAGFPIHLEDSDVVAALVAAKQEPAGGIEIETARITHLRPFFPCESQVAVWANSKNSDADQFGTAN